jgi:hypothetical protein
MAAQARKTRKVRTYLSGGMEYAAKEGIGWRGTMEKWIKDHLHHAVFNPNTKSDRYLSKVLHNKNFRDLKTLDIELYKKIVRKFVDEDSHAVALWADYVICYWDESAQQGAGTKGELTIARYFKKPVYCVTAMNAAQIPGWVLGCVTRSFETFEELQVFLLQKYAPKGKAHEKDKD